MPKPDTFVAREIPFFDPVCVFRAQAEEPFAQLLHSVPGAAGGGRYSFIALDPFETLITANGQTSSKIPLTAGSPFDLLQTRLRRYHQPSRPGLPPFQGGAVGQFSYELAHHLERIRPPTRDEQGLPDMAVGFYDVVAAVDWQTRRAWILSTGLPEQDEQRRRHRAEARADELEAKLGRNAGTAPSKFAFNQPQSNRTKSDYVKAVRRTIDYIYAGDIYQANISQQFETALHEETSAFDLFERMIAASPVSYASYLNFSNATIISTSPERFVQVADPHGSRRVQTRPIKGTTGRGQTPGQDNDQRTALTASEKDRAENIMIVDLLRNDLSKVCEDASVKVTELCALESYAAVHHLVSTIEGRLSPGRDGVDLLKACFPGGSITGAPKVRAMEIIAELEGVNRGTYCGAIGYLGFDGAMDTSIAIRTLSVIDDRDGRRAIFPVGGGIVADSDPESEYQESLLKAQAFFQALSEKQPAL